MTLRSSTLTFSQGEAEAGVFRLCNRAEKRHEFIAACWGVQSRFGWQVNDPVCGFAAPTAF